MSDEPAPDGILVWVISPDYHSEGLAEPIAAFLSEKAAQEAMQLLSHCPSSFKITKLKVFGRV